MNTMKKIVAFAMIISMVLGCVIISTSAAEQRPYVTDGLIAWYDASNNANGSMDPMSDLWKDLSGNANHIDISAAVSNNQIKWENGALVINKDTGCYMQLPDAVKAALMGDAYTIEIVTGNLNYTASAYITLLSSSNDELSVFIRCGGEYADTEGNDNKLKLEYKNQDANGDSNRPFVYNAWNHFNGKTLAVTADLKALDDNGRDNNEGTTETDNVIMYSDAVRIGSGESEFNMDLDYVYFGQTAENRRWGGEIYALRIYDRALTAEEVAANTAADQFNYRSGQTIEPTQKYDPINDEKYEGFTKLEGYTNNKIVFNADTDLIPLTGFYGSVNLLDYLYPYASDAEKWEGARLMKTEEADTDYDGSVRSGTNFSIMYQSFCTRAGLTACTGPEASYIVVKLMTKGEFEDLNLRAIAYDADTDSELEFSTGSMYGGIDFDKEGEVQYLIYDVEGIFDDAEAVTKFYMDIQGMNDETEIYLYEIALFSNEKDAYVYAGEEYEDDDTTEAPAGGDETKDPAGNDETKAPTGNDETKAPAGNDETKAPAGNDGGCASVVGFGAAAIMVAAAAAVVLKKKD